MLYIVSTANGFHSIPVRTPGKSSLGRNYVNVVRFQFIGLFSEYKNPSRAMKFWSRV